MRVLILPPTTLIEKENSDATHDPTHIVDFSPSKIAVDAFRRVPAL
jgi:hypothetical protein